VYNKNQYRLKKEAKCCFLLIKVGNIPPKGDLKVGVLAATQVKTHEFNDLYEKIYQFKIKNINFKAGNVEIKGNRIFKKYVLGLEEQGITFQELDLAREGRIFL